MDCYAHPGVEAIGICTICGRAICKEDTVQVRGRLVCREDLAKGALPISNSMVNVSSKTYDPNTVFLIELIAGFFGLLGIGYIYVGRTNDGVIRLIAWLLYDLLAACVIMLLLAIIVGIVCIPIQLVIQIGIPLWSANKLKNELMQGSSI